MWYAVQVRTGQEEKIRAICNMMIPKDVLEECVIPQYQNKKKYLGSWHTSTEILFPGYIFMISEYIDNLRSAVKNISSLIRILGDGENIISLYEKEVEFLKKFGEEDYLIKMSKVYMENERIIIIDGPMKDFEGTIKKIDRHKRNAIIAVEFFGRVMEFHVGMEIIVKV